MSRVFFTLCKMNVFRLAQISALIQAFSQLFVKFKNLPNALRFLCTHNLEVLRSAVRSFYAASSATSIVPNPHIHSKDKNVWFEFLLLSSHNLNGLQSAPRVVVCLYLWYFGICVLSQFVVRDVFSFHFFSCELFRGMTLQATKLKVWNNLYCTPWFLRIMVA